MGNLSQCPVSDISPLYLERAPKTRVKKEDSNPFPGAPCVLFPRHPCHVPTTAGPDPTFGTVVPGSGADRGASEVTDVAEEAPAAQDAEEIEGHDAQHGMLDLDRHEGEDDDGHHGRRVGQCGHRHHRVDGAGGAQVRDGHQRDLWRQGRGGGGGGGGDGPTGAGEGREGL